MFSIFILSRQGSIRLPRGWVPDVWPVTLSNPRNGFGVSLETSSNHEGGAPIWFVVATCCETDSRHGRRTRRCLHNKVSDRKGFATRHINLYPLWPIAVPHGPGLGEWGSIENALCVAFFASGTHMHCVRGGQAILRAVPWEGSPCDTLP